MTTTISFTNLMTNNNNNTDRIRRLVLNYVIIVWYLCITIIRGRVPVGMHIIQSLQNAFRQLYKTRPVFVFVFLLYLYVYV